MYAELLQRYRKEYGFKLFAYVLLPQHLHLLIEPRENMGISEIMRSLNTAYSKYFNNCYNRQGHLFRERFRACIVEKEPYLLKLTAHIHLNPLRIGLVSNYEEYSYSNYNLYQEGSYYKDRDVREAVGYLGVGLERGSYRDYMEKELQEKMADLYKRLHRGGILGSKEFVKKVREKIHKKEKEGDGEGGSFRRNVLLGVGATLGIVGVIATVSLWQFRKGGFLKEKIQIGKGEDSFIVDDIQDLDNTEWKVKFISVDSDSKVVESFIDTLSFSNGKFVSAKFSQKGFNPTNYSVTQEKNRIIWETIQSKENKSISWRGEIEANKMRGVVSLRSQNETQDFSFVSLRYRRK
jgi:REP element-mobilizing transposase RayT